MINWGALGVVVLVALALVGLSAREGAVDTVESADGTEPVGRATTAAMSPAAGTGVAAVCLLGVAAIVLYGLYLIIFHH